MQDAIGRKETGIEERNGRFRGFSPEEIFEMLHLTEVFNYRTLSNNGKSNASFSPRGRLANMAANR